ncbi:MAG: hypothetical protein EA356_08025 [Geminicoccaceae bacterium]|nr:MAG: hypothetical protein EA356_08025 [Geminicoccaceae bacterium]
MTARTRAEPPLALTLDAAFAAKGVTARLGCLAFSVPGRRGDLGPALDAAAVRVRETPLAEVAPIQATRRAYKALGKDPSRYRPASEALWRRLQKGEAPPRIHDLVDLNTLISLETGLAAGIYDRRHLAPPLHYRVGLPGETYPAIGGQEAFNLTGLPLLADREGPFGSPTRDGARARVRADTAEALLVLFAFDMPDLPGALSMAQNAVERYMLATEVDVWQVA